MGLQGGTECSLSVMKARFGVPTGTLIARAT